MTHSVHLGIYFHVKLQQTLQENQGAMVLFSLRRMNLHSLLLINSMGCLSMTRKCLLDLLFASRTGKMSRVISMTRKCLLDLLFASRTGKMSRVISNLVMYM
uniref:Uncharacterized protein n=1 Tax=Zea mays TaxID=4577 RepID=C4J7X9_MAIZE|nr:unknown [Zea mays]